MKKSLIIGASGTVGSGIVRALRERGEAVRAVSHRAPGASADGTEWVQANLVTGVGVNEAFAGVDRAFLLSPPGHADQQILLSPLVREARRQGLRKVVLMTAMGVDAAEGSPFHRAERELAASGLEYHIVRPNWFLQNFHTFWLSGIRAQGKILLPAGQSKVSFIDARDVSDVAAQLLSADGISQRTFDLTGPAALSHADIAQLLTKATGRAISYEEISPADFRAGLVGAGLGADYADFLNAIFGPLREGYAARVTGEVRAVTGHAPRTAQAYAVEHRAAWL